MNIFLRSQCIKSRSRISSLNYVQEICFLYLFCLIFLSLTCQCGGVTPFTCLFSIKFQLDLLAICAGRATTILSSSKVHPSSLSEIPTSARFIRSHIQHRLVLRTVRNIRISICPLPPYIIHAIEFANIRLLVTNEPVLLLFKIAHSLY